MTLRLLAAIESTLQRSVKQLVLYVALGSLGFIALLVGAGFLTASAYLALAAKYGVVKATLTIGLGYLGIGALAVMIIALRRPAPPPPQAAPPLGEALMAGFEAGREFGKGFKSAR